MVVFAMSRLTFSGRARSLLSMAGRGARCGVRGAGSGLKSKASLKLALSTLDFRPDPVMGLPNSSEVADQNENEV